MASNKPFDADLENVFIKSLLLPGWAMKRIPGYEGKHTFWKRYRIISLLLVPVLVGVPLYIVGGVVSGFQSLVAAETANRAYMTLRKQEQADIEELKELQSVSDDANA